MKYTTVGFSSWEKQFIQDVLDDPRAWNVKFVCSASPNLVVYKATGEEIDSLYPSLKGLSVCDRSSTPTRIYIRSENWNQIPKASGYESLQGYRIYLICHEFGHALGHGHSRCVKPGPCPVMVQQTLGTGLCYPHPWVVKT